jgi:thymidylate kinase
MIFIVEGADGTGKTTLGKAIAKEIGATVLHCSFYPTWDIEKYHKQIMIMAKCLEKVCGNVVIDRWAPSEFVYGSIFRGGESYDTRKLMKETTGVKWVMCTNQNVVENHKRNSKNRYEMFEDMEKVSYFFDRLAEEHIVEWYFFDFDRISTSEFIKKLIKEEKCQK